MKYNLVLLGIAVAMTVAPSVRAGSPTSKEADGTSAGHSKGQKAAVAQAPRKAEPIYFYITNRPITGSHLPLVICRYEGHNSSSSPLAIYRSLDISTTGALNVGGALRELDPAISVR